MLALARFFATAVSVRWRFSPFWAEFTADGDIVNRQEGWQGIYYSNDNWITRKRMSKVVVE